MKRTDQQIKAAGAEGSTSVVHAFEGQRVYFDLDFIWFLEPNFPTAYTVVWGLVIIQCGKLGPLVVSTWNLPSSLFSSRRNSGFPHTKITMN